MAGTFPRVGAGVFLLAAGLALVALPPRAAAADLCDPLGPLLHRMHSYFQGHEVDGVTLDSRYAINPSEAIRMSVVCQLLGYAELHRADPTCGFRRDIVQHADFLVGRLDQIRSHTPFDGMLGYSLLAAYEATADSQYLATGTIIVNELEATPTRECILNGGLMVAMATAEYCRLTGDADAGQKTRDILSQLAPFQHSDGSFPHWCAGSTDIHYTDWMAMELILIQRMMADPIIEPTLERMHAFMEDRVDSTGRTHYEDLCPTDPDCMVYYYSRATGCSIDYDTRGWTVEPGYSAVLFDHFRSPKYGVVMRYLLSLENGGTFADKWDYPPPPDDPEYPWSIADTSVSNMSIIFWSLASILGGRGGQSSVACAWAAEDDPGREVVGAPEWVLLPLGIAAGAGTPRWRTVDSLLVAGMDPGAYSDDGSWSRPTGGGDERPRGGRLTPSGFGACCGDAHAAASPGVRLGPIVTNPARDACEVRFTLPVPAMVSLAIYDASGRLVRELVSGALGAGGHEAWWDRRDAAGSESRSGLYFVRLRAGDVVRSARIAVIR